MKDRSTGQVVELDSSPLVDADSPNEVFRDLCAKECSACASHDGKRSVREERNGEQSLKIKIKSP